MAKITDLNPITVDRTTDVLVVEDISATETKKGTVNSILGFTGGNPVSTSDSATLTNKTLDNTNALTLKDNSFTLQDDSDTTKQAQFQLNGITTGTTRTYTLPNASSTLVDLSSSQTLTSKTLTSPVINTATISNPTLSIDSIAEFNSAAGVTIDGVLLKDSKINGSYLTDASVTATQVDFGGSGSGIWWQEIGRTTLTPAGDTLTVSSLPARKYLQVRLDLIPTGGTITTSIRYNNDSAANYSQNGSTSFGAASGLTAQTSHQLRGASNNAAFAILDIVNVLATEKKVIAHLYDTNTAGAATAPTNTEVFAKWANTAAQINRIDVVNTGAGDFAIGSEIVVLGHN